jgi:gamma-glutamyltranspeptidase/glutathione hydrolase
VLLQALNILENFELEPMGYNSARYLHVLYQAMNLAFADRDFYYGDPDVEPAEPIRGLLSKAYARDRAATIDWERNDADARPGDPYPYQDGANPFRAYLDAWHTKRPAPAAATDGDASGAQAAGASQDRRARVAMNTDRADPAAWEADPFYRGTTSVQTTDAEGWVVSVTPSGGWIPAVIAGRTGIGLSQRAQQFVTDPRDNPYNVIAPGKRPRVTLTPSMALKDGAPFLSFAVQGGDSQDQNLLQFFLNVVEFDMNVQQAAEAANINSFQMRSSFGDHDSDPGRMLVQEDTPPWVVGALRRMGYDIDTGAITSGPINAIFFDREHGTFWGGSSHHGEDYGIAW